MSFCLGVHCALSEKWALSSNKIKFVYLLETPKWESTNKCTYFLYGKLIRSSYARIVPL